MKVLLLYISILTAFETYFCSCPGTPIEEHIQEVDLAFIGEPILLYRAKDEKKLMHSDSTFTTYGAYDHYKFIMKEKFKGELLIDTLWITTVRGACMSSFDMNIDYLIFAKNADQFSIEVDPPYRLPRDSNVYITSRCYKNLPVNARGPFRSGMEDIKYLRGLKN